MNGAEIEHRFARHDFSLGQNVASHIMRRHYLQLAHQLNAALPDGREKSLAITQLEASLMWANKALSSQKEEPEVDVVVSAQGEPGPALCTHPDLSISDIRCRALGLAINDGSASTEETVKRAVAYAKFIMES